MVYLTEREGNEMSEGDSQLHHNADIEFYNSIFIFLNSNA